VSANVPQSTPQKEKKKPDQYQVTYRTSLNRDAQIFTVFIPCRYKLSFPNPKIRNQGCSTNKVCANMPKY
jgi:hypothetical protein